MRLKDYTNQPNIIDVITALVIIDDCHNAHSLNESVLDNVKTIVSKLKTIINNKKSGIIHPEEMEKGLLSYLKDIGLGGSQMIYHAFNAFYNKDNTSKERMKELKDGVKKEHIIDILVKLDVLTLHLISGPIHIMDAVTGWNVMHKLKFKIEPIDKKAKDAIHTLESLRDELDGRLKSQLQTYANAIRRVFNIGDFKKVTEETLGADVANPDVLIGDKPVNRLEDPKDKRKRKKYKKYLIVKRDDE